jgi:broad specificity phosphatase PhoE
LRRCAISIVYLIRHGETDWNRGTRIQGRIDIPLNERGKQQAEALAVRLASIPLEVIYTSDLGRAQETAGRIAARQPEEVAVLKRPGLRECDYGLWEGLTRAEVVERFPEEWDEWFRTGGIGGAPEGEDFFSLVKRASVVFDEASRQGKTVLISAHHGPIQAILCHALGIAEILRSRFLIQNCSLSALECQEGGITRLILLNDTCHLDGLA